MRGIYFTTMCNIEDPNDNDNPGIKEKIKYQYKSFQNAGIDMQFFYAHKKSKAYRYINRLPLYRDNYDTPDTVSKADFIYLRKPSTINMGFIDFLRRIRKLNPTLKIMLEIPTYPYDNEIQGVVRMPLKYKDKYARKKLHKYVDVVLTYSNDSEIFGIQAINISNGVNTEIAANYLKKYQCLDDGVVRFMACAKFNLWHGYDRAIEGLYSYLKDPHAKTKVEIEMVGDGESLASYKKLVDQYGLHQYVKFHGRLQGEELGKMYSICDIGFDSMGRHRSGVYYNSSLKGKEYAAYGLMIVSGVETELDHVDDFDYYFRIPADDSPVDFNSVLAFYKKQLDRSKEKTIVRKTIAQYAKDHFDISVVFRPVIDYLFS